ncbi:MAG: acyl-CoA thioesterase [Phormidesmis sp.]
MPFVYRRVIRFHETDAAGVVYFASLLSLCHEAYEAAIASASTLNPKDFFSGAATTAVPIVHTAADFYQPLFCGDAVSITLTPQQLTSHSFEISYDITKAVAKGKRSTKPLVHALTRHVCIATATRRRTDLPPELLSWLTILSVKETEEGAEFEPLQPDG